MSMALASTIIWLINEIIGLYIIVIFAAVIASWLIAFNVVNIRNEAVRAIVRVIDALTDPVFRLVRRVIPPIGGLDLSPMIVLLALWAFQYFLGQLAFNYGIGA